MLLEVVGAGAADADGLHGGLRARVRQRANTRLLYALPGPASRAAKAAQAPGRPGLERGAFWAMRRHGPARRRSATTIRVRHNLMAKGLGYGTRHQQSHSDRQPGRGPGNPVHALRHDGHQHPHRHQRELEGQAVRREEGAHRVAQRRDVRPPRRDRRRIPAQGLAGLHRGLAAHPQVAGQGRQGPLHHRDRRQRDADARRPRRRWRRRRRQLAAASRRYEPRERARGEPAPAGAGAEAISTTTFRSDA